MIVYMQGDFTFDYFFGSTSLISRRLFQVRLVLQNVSRGDPFGFLKQDFFTVLMPFLSPN